ncbi:MAG: sulfurtransferase [Gaiellales bacterium]
MNSSTHILQLPAGPLVSPSWLEHHCSDRRVRILDTRGRVPAPGSAPAPMRHDYEAGHVPGALFVNWSEDFIDPDDPVPNQLASPERFAAAAGELGIDEGTIVVVYDDYRSVFAARLWWAFRAMGHDAVRVLDGGLRGWIDSGHALEQGLGAVHHPTTFTPRPRPELRWTIDQVTSRDEDVVLVDARSRERFAGEGTDPVGGHIPGAVNAPYVELVGSDGFMRPPDALRAVFARAGIDPDDPSATLVASCGSGISASVPLLALEALRADSGTRAAVYDGSWAEWSRSGQPITTGPA